MEYRVLSREEISKLEQLDRSESVDNVYYMREESLALEKEHWDVPDWSPEEKQVRIDMLQECYDKSATFFGAFDGATLAGIAVLDHNPVKTGVGRLNLSGLWVSRPHRGKGVARTLVQMAEKTASELGAKALYVSATPSENTVRFYQSVGFNLAEQIDPTLYEKEPDDIHMEMTLR